ncbi:MAG: (d)CMP kinase [Ruminococcaceae bacterium]|nr:(d)CMP kinase [Oscillospiraceae bacterium]
MKYAVAIDGPAGAGKSSIAKEVSKRLGFIYVDTGALYRTVALYLLNNGIKADEIDKIEEALKHIEVSMEHKEDGQHVFLCGEDVSHLIRTEPVSMMASTTSALPVVRKFLFDLQVQMAEKYNVIMDGRDIGTVVLPNAQVKIFLTATAEDRAKRRMLEYKAKGQEADFDKILEDIIKRDYQDMNRATSPLKKAEDAILLDTTGNEFSQSVELMMNTIKSRLSI